MAWYTKYLNRITPEMIEDFIKKQGASEQETNLAGAAWLMLSIANDEENKCKYLEELSKLVDLSMSAFLHKIVQPKCVNCKNCDMEEDRYLENCIYHQISAFDDEILYIVLPSRNKTIDAPPLGYDCWEPKKTEAKNETTKI